MQWATDLTLSDDPHRRELGYTATDLLGRSSLAGPEELALLDVVLTAELSRRPGGPWTTMVRQTATPDRRPP